LTAGRDARRIAGGTPALRGHRGSTLASPICMNWIVWLGFAVFLTVIAAVTGFKPKGTRHVAHSRMMGMGRVFLMILVVIFAVLAYRARGG
ncbi:MAG: hypothetical protein ABI837_09680, partial [Acidobacteriota bacterium]